MRGDRWTWWPWAAGRPEGSGALAGFRRQLPVAHLTRGAVVLGLVSAAALAPTGGQGLTWRVVPSPNVNFPAESSTLDAVSCVSPAGCMAVGSYYGTHQGGAPETALAESWNGTRWSVAPASRPVRGVLLGVSCTSAASCVAVGRSGVNPTTQFMESWNGTTWSVMPAAATVGSELLGVSCVSAADCTAVGDRFRSPRDLTFIESWNGTTWSTVPSPDTKAGQDSLVSVSCVSRTACTAAGVHFSPGFSTRPLIESWNGKRWSLTLAPNVNNNASFSGISCVSIRSCVAVGDYLDKSVDNKSLIESWNGTRWTIEPTPKEQSELLGVSCVSATNCRAAGFAWTPFGNTNTLIESWNGSRWAIEPTPNPPPASDFHNLLGVSCASARFCAAAGTYGDFSRPHAPARTVTEIGSAHT